MAKPKAPESPLDPIVALCKRRGFVYPASEIYGGINGFWDYGPLGVLLKNNVRDHWWRHMVECPPIGPDGDPLTIVGLDSSIIQNPKTWISSGHVGGFSDPMGTCKHCKKLLRADHVGDMLKSSDWVAAARASLDASDDATLLGFAKSQKGGKLAPGLAKIAEETGAVPDRYEQAVREVETLGESDADLPCPVCGGEVSEPRDFNLMFESYAGVVQEEDNKVYLRPETAQGIFLNYKNVVDTTRVKVPFGIAQVGKSFRNEVTPRNFIFRSREFEQMEMEWFCPPDESQKWYEFWKQERMRWWLSLGLDPDNLVFRDHEQDELSHYSNATVDIEYRYPFTAPDFGELEGIAHRGHFDLNAHQDGSGLNLEYFDQEKQVALKNAGAEKDEIKAKSKYLPHVIEPASGLTRAVLVMLCEAYTPDESRASGVYMKFKPKFAPIKCGVFPLVNKDGMPERATAIYRDLRESFTCEYDPKQSIGKRYARMDEIGTPFCVTIDGDTLTDGTVTVRHRDSQEQERVPEANLKRYLQDKLAE